MWQYSREYKGFVLWPCAVFCYLRIHGSVARIWVKVQSRSIRLLCSFLSHLHSRASSQKEWRCIIWKTQWRSGRVLAWHLWVHGLEDPRYCKRKIKCPALVVHICIGRQEQGGAQIWYRSGLHSRSQAFLVTIVRLCLISPFKERHIY